MLAVQFSPHRIPINQFYFLQSFELNHCVQWFHKSLISDSSTTSLIFTEPVLKNGKHCFMFYFITEKTLKCHLYGAANDTNFSSHSLEEV